jgi:type II secretion system protein N
MTPERKGQLWRGATMLGAGLLVFVVAFYVVFPYDRIKDLVVALASQQDIDLEIGEAGPALGVGVSFTDITVRTRPREGGKPIRWVLDGASVTVSPLAQLSGTMAASAQIDGMGGEVEIDFEESKTRRRLRASTRDVALSELPGVKETISVPLAGAIELEVDLDQPNRRVTESAGAISWKCLGCVIGDGKAKLKVAGNPLLAEGISLPKLRLGDFGGRVNIQKGQGKLQNVKAKSPDGEIMVMGEIRLAEPIANSQIDLYLMFKFTDALLKSSEKLALMMQIAESMGKRSDGFLGVRLSGTLGRLGTFQWSKTSPFASADMRQPSTLAVEGVAPSLPSPPPPSRPERPAALRRAILSVTPATDPTPIHAAAGAGGRLVNPATEANANMPRYATESPQE